MIQSSIGRFFFDNRWNLGFIDSIDDVMGNKPYSVHWMKHSYKNRWFADPFILSVSEDKIFVLVEEFLDSIKRGRISLLEVLKKDYSLQKITPCLELPTHLSFPAILRTEEGVFVYPENSESGKLSLYKLSEDGQLISPKVIAKEPLTDAIITSLFGDDLIFSTDSSNPNGAELNVYKNIRGLFEKDSAIRFEKKIARNAGQWFEYKGEIYRPAQDCSGYYGGAFIIQKVSKKNEHYSFENIIRIESSNKKYNIGCHTFNSYDGMCVIDVNGYRRPLIAKLGLLISKVKTAI